MAGQIDLSAGLEPKDTPQSAKKTGGVKRYQPKTSEAPIDLSAGLEPVSDVPRGTSDTPDLTSNPIDPKTGKGEGLYRMGSYDFHEGETSKPEIQVPFSKVQQAIDEGYKLHPDEVARHKKDSTHVGEGPTLVERAGSAVNKALEPVPNEKLGEHILTNADRAAGRTIAALPGYFVDLATAASDFVRGRTDGSQLVDLIDPTKVPENLYKQYQEDAKIDPKMAAQNLVGTLVGLGVVAAVTHGAKEGLKERLLGTKEYGETSPKPAKPVGKLIEDVRKQNFEAKGAHLEYEQALRTKAGEIRAEDAKQEAARRAEFESKRQPVVEHNKATAKTAEEKEAATTLANSSEPKIKAKLKETEETVNEEANKKYNDIRGKIGEEQIPVYQRVGPDGHIQGEPVPYLQHIYDNAVSKITDWSNDPALIKNLGKRLEGTVGEPGDPNGTYGDLQDLRTKVGGALRNGGLASDIFHAYKGMMEDIDEGMQQVADAHDMGTEQTEAREYYKRYAEVFLDESSPIRKSIHAGIEAKTGSLFKNFHGRDAALEALAEYNPELAGTIKGIAEAQSMAAKTRVPPSKPEPTTPQPLLTSGSPEERAAQEVEPPEGPDVGRKINTADVRRVKEEEYRKWIDNVRGKGVFGATILSMYALRSLLHGELSPLVSVPADIGGALAVTRGIASVMEKTSVVDFFTKATAKDIASIPPDLRGDLPELVKAAKAKGIKVSPVLVAAVNAASRPQKQETQQ